MEDTKIGNNTLTEFTLFPELPVEMQDEIWKQVARLQPRIVVLKWNSEYGDTASRTETITIRQINRKTRSEAVIIHGYVGVLEPGCSDTPKRLLVNPEMDLIYVVFPSEPLANQGGGSGCIYCWENRFHAVANVLDGSAIISRVKCVAVEAHELDYHAALKGNLIFFFISLRVWNWFWWFANQSFGAASQTKRRKFSSNMFANRR
jgi:hypothetical protein